MDEETIEGWEKVYETYDYMQSELTEAKLHDEAIEYQLMNKADIGYTMDLGNSDMGRSAVNMPFKFFVKPEDKVKALKVINEDKSGLLDDPNLDFNNTDDKK